MTYWQFLVWVKKNAGIIENLRSGETVLKVQKLLVAGEVEFSTPLERRVFQLAHAAAVGPVHGHCCIIATNELITRAGALSEIERYSDEGGHIRRYRKVALSRVVGSPDLKFLVANMEMLVE